MVKIRICILSFLDRQSSKRFFHSPPSSLFNDNHSISNDAVREAVTSHSTVFRHYERDEFERKDRLSFPNSQRKSSISNLFEAYEEDDKQKIKKLVEGIQSFDRCVNYYRIDGHAF